MSPYNEYRYWKIVTTGEAYDFAYSVNAETGVWIFSTPTYSLTKELGKMQYIIKLNGDFAYADTVSLWSVCHSRIG